MGCSLLSIHFLLLLGNYEGIWCFLLVERALVACSDWLIQLIWHVVNDFVVWQHFDLVGE